MLAARTFNQGFATAEYAASALLDLDIHEAAEPEAIDPAAFEEALRARLGVPGAIALRHRPAHFQHIFAGSSYAAGYYTYLWAEVMEADAFGAFEEAGDIFDPAVAARLHQYVYSSGGKMKPDEAYRAFPGEGPIAGAPDGEARAYHPRAGLNAPQAKAPFGIAPPQLRDGRKSL